MMSYFVKSKPKGDSEQRDLSEEVHVADLFLNQESPGNTSSFGGVWLQILENINK